MNRFALAFRAFFALLFEGVLSDDVVTELGLSKKPTAPRTPAAAPAPPRANAVDGALQMLGILQRDGHMLDFFMEDITPYSDEQVGNAAREVHAQVKETLNRYFRFQPVIDGVEGAFTNAPAKDPSLVKFLGNVPATLPSGGVLRHHGWRVTETEFPTLPTGQNVKVLAPAELEVE